MSIKDKPAFPTVLDDGCSWTQGMTLRDYFAAKAIQGMFANDTMLARFTHDGAKDLIDPEVLAVSAAYSIADAMLEARNK